MFIFILPSISDGIKTEDLFWRKLVANSNQTSTWCLCYAHEIPLSKSLGKEVEKHRIRRGEAIQLD